MRIHYLLPIIALSLPNMLAQPETPVSEWRDKTILVIGAHPDDDSHAHGTLALLQKSGNEIWTVILTTGNVGTLDPKLSRFDLARIRRQEQIDAMAELGIPADHYINLGYDDGLIEFESRKEIVGRLVRLIRRIRPDVLFAFDPGRGYQRWHKSDHRTAAYLAADAARAAMWRLLFEGQVIHEGLKEFQIPEYMLFDSLQKDLNTFVDISDTLDQKINAHLQYASQFSSGMVGLQRSGNPLGGEPRDRRTPASTSHEAQRQTGRRVQALQGPAGWDWEIGSGFWVLDHLGRVHL